MFRVLITHSIYEIDLLSLCLTVLSNRLQSALLIFHFHLAYSKRKSIEDNSSSPITQKEVFWFYIIQMQKQAESFTHIVIVRTH